MLQEIITYIILIITFSYVGYKFIKTISNSKKGKSPCSGCSMSSGCSGCVFKDGIDIKKLELKR